MSTAGAGEVLTSRAARAQHSVTAHVGMIAFLASWAMLFAGLFFAFGLARARATTWPPQSLPPLPQVLPAVNTAVIALSSAVLVFGLRRLRRGGPIAGALALATGLGGAFVGLQIALWLQVWEVGLLPSSGQYGALFYTFTWVHAAHVLVGVGALCYLAVRAARGAYSPQRHLGIKLWSMYWHFVGVAWLAMFAMLFLS